MMLLVLADNAAAIGVDQPRVGLPILRDSCRAHDVCDR